MGSRLGITKIAAKRAGITLEEYEARIASGMLRCWKCKAWKRADEFYPDASRGSGRSAVCMDCKNNRQAPGPDQRIRKAQRKIGLSWCSGCETWLASDEVTSGKCKACRSKRERERYSQDRAYRIERRQHAHGRSRGVAPIPAVGQDVILEDFDNRCAYCGGHAETWDHVTPISMGGQTTPGNIVPACRACNSSKRDRDASEWMKWKGIEASEAFLDRVSLADAGFYG